VDLSQWLVGEIDDITTRLRTQVLEIVPPTRRRERPGGGSPILWNTSTPHGTRRWPLRCFLPSQGQNAPLGWTPWSRKRARASR
jgi:hypothetical protein